MCRVLEVSTSGYYAWRRRPSSRRAQENAILSGRIAEIHEQSQGIYGSRRVHAELRAQGVVISWQRVARLMRASGLKWLILRHAPVQPSPAPNNNTRLSPLSCKHCCKTAAHSLAASAPPSLPAVENLLEKSFPCRRE